MTRQADVVTVNGTNQADRVGVTAPGGQVEVAGLQADTQIAGERDGRPPPGQHPRRERPVDVDPAVATLIGVAVDLGLGQL